MQRMTVSAEDRALIDEFIRTKGVTVCPPYTFSDDESIDLDDALEILSAWAPPTEPEQPQTEMLQ